MAREEATPGEGRSNGLFWLSGMFVLVVLLVGVGLVIWLTVGGGDEKPSSTVTTRSAPAPSESSGSGAGSEPASDAGCAGVTPNDDPATTAPKSVSWDPAGVVSMPRAKDVGPMKVTGRDRTCFAHSRQGAAFAAANIMTASMGWGDNSIIEKRFTPGPGRDELVAQEGQTGQVDLVGYRVTSYDRSHAVVNLAFKQDGAMASMPVALIWRDGDWYGDGGPTGVATGQSITDLAGYTTLAK